MARCLYCLNVNDFSSVRKLNAHEVRKLSKTCISEECVAICTVPVLEVTELVARCLYCLNVNDLRSVRNGKVLSIGKLSESLISVYSLTVGAVPVLSRA